MVCLYATVNDRREDADKFLCEKIVICLYVKEESDRENAEIGKILKLKKNKDNLLFHFLNVADLGSLVLFVFWISLVMHNTSIIIGMLDLGEILVL